MITKLLNGGIYNLKQESTGDETYIIVIKQGHDSVIILFPHIFIQNMSRIHNRHILNDVVSSAIHVDKVKEEYFCNSPNFSEKQIIGYLGQVDEKILKKLRAIVVTKFPWI